MPFNLEVSFAELKKDVQHIREKVDKQCETMSEHMKESIPVREEVRDNSKFRGSAIWVLRAIYGTMIAVIAKVWFLK